MDVTPFLDIKPAPCAVFERLDSEPERRDMARFYVRAPDRGGADEAGGSAGSDRGDGGDGAAGQRWTAVTWGAFADEIRDVSLHLCALGVSPGDRAAIFAPNRVEWASAALGIQTVGGVVVPVYPASTTEQLAYVLDHSDARALYVDTPALLSRALTAWDRCPKLEHVIILGDDTTIPDDAPEPIRERIAPWHAVRAAGAAAHARSPGALRALLGEVSLSAPGLMLYTSGTSGAPKGVPLTHRNVGANAADWLVCNAPLLDEGMVDLLWLPMSHIFGLGEMCLGNTLGFTSYLATPADALAVMPEVKPSVFMSVPAYWEKLAMQALAEPDPARRKARLDDATGGRLRFCLSGGAGLKREVKQLFHDCGVLIIEGYGLTETSPTLTLNRPGAFRFDTVGLPLPSLKISLAPDGEILARGPNVFSGYHKDPAATAAAFTDDGWFRTGDIGRFTDDGFLQIVDRKKDILVTAGGKNVPPANIEMRFHDDPLIDHVVVYGDGKSYLVAGVWPNTAACARSLGAEAGSPEALRALIEARVAAVNQGLARHETIKRFAIMDAPLTVEAGLLTASLKIRRKAIYARFDEVFESLYLG